MLDYEYGVADVQRVQDGTCADRLLWHSRSATKQEAEDWITEQLEAWNKYDHHNMTRDAYVILRRPKVRDWRIC